jgi:thiol-disulfide isomerase/thioredoxin
MRSTARLLLLPVLLFSFVAPATAKPSTTARGTSASTAARGPAPSFALPTINGTVSLDSLRGRVVLIDFWASWCEPCRRSFPWLADLHRRYAAKGLTIVAINLDKKRGAADAFLEKYPAPFVVAFDPAGKTAEAFKVSVMPSSFLVGPTGAVLFRHAGFRPNDTGTLESMIQEACRP